MAKLHLLGTGAAVSDPHRTTSMLALENDHGIILVDCGGDALQRLAMTGGDPKGVRALIVTHEHADHVSGFPLLMEKLWLYGRREPLDVYGIEPAIEQARRVHDSFDTSAWPGYPGVRYHSVDQIEGAPVLDGFGWRIEASPGVHAVPVVGLRAADESGAIVAYSCDTEFSEVIVRMARGANVLVHEATGEGPGHSNALQAAQAAKAAAVERLLLVHLPGESALGEHEMAEARKVFARTEKGVEGGVYAL